jgi:hypothetical protein
MPRFLHDAFGRFVFLEPLAETLSVIQKRTAGGHNGEKMLTKSTSHDIMFVGTWIITRNG